MFSSISSPFNKRGLPLGISALRSCTASYSQCGEDSIVASLISRDIAPELYLDLGCYHPLTWSNTYHFYRRGWKGLCVDASDKYQKEWRVFRPRDKYTTAAIIPSNEYKVVQFVQDTGSEATSFVTTEKVETNSPNLIKSSLKTLSIANLVSWWPFSKPPSIVSSDIEGMDKDIWMNFPFDEIRPGIIIMEIHNFTDNQEENKDLQDRLYSFNYKLYGMAGPSLIYKQISQ